MSNENNSPDTTLDFTKEVDNLNIISSEEAYKNSIIGKKYNFASSKGANLRGLLNSRIRSEVTFSDDRLFINIEPKRFNTAPAILYKDITGVIITVKINFYYWIYIIVSVLCAIVNPFLLIVTVLLFFIGRDSKITITQQNGISAVIYAKTKAEAEAFKEDMRKVARIQ